MQPSTWLITDYQAHIRTTAHALINEAARVFGAKMEAGAMAQLPTIEAIKANAVDTTLASTAPRLIVDHVVDAINNMDVGIKYVINQDGKRLVVAITVV